jgi:hypothetical protein
MATVRRREGKRGVSWQIDYFDPPQPLKKHFKDVDEARKAPWGIFR